MAPSALLSLTRQVPRSICLFTSACTFIDNPVRKNDCPTEEVTTLVDLLEQFFFFIYLKLEKVKLELAKLSHTIDFFCFVFYILVGKSEKGSVQ